MFELEVETEFAAAHALREYKGKCENLHGHNYRVLLSVAGDNLDQIGMLCDFKEIKRLLKRVLEPIDHQYLNDTEPFCKMNPTTENLAKYICTEIAPQIVACTEGRGMVTRVKVWETDSCSATYFYSK